MTRISWAAGSGGRGTPSSASLVRLIVVIALVVGGCGDGRPTTVSASPPPNSGGPSSPDASAEAGPKPTPWPGNAVIGVTALGAADGQILAALNDLGRGIATEDLALIRRAADFLAGLDVLLPNLEKIEIYEPMVPFAERYGAAMRGIIAAAKAVRSAIDAGDATAITTTTGALIESLGAYTDVQPELADWVEQSIAQRRLILR